MGRFSLGRERIPSIGGLNSKQRTAWAVLRESQREIAQYYAQNLSVRVRRDLHHHLSSRPSPPHPDCGPRETACFHHLSPG